ncbi:MAG: WYL domain-containing protein [Bacteroidota bacterium]
MSKREYIARNLLIINFLKRGRASWDEIEFHLETQSELEGYNYLISQRTFQRDMIEIRSLYQIDIQNDKATGLYYIAEQEDGLQNNWQLLDSFNLYNALSLTSNYSEYIQFDSRVPKGTEHILPLLNAIKNKLTIEFEYHKFYESESETVLFHPYLIKQFKSRWYVIGIKAESNSQRTYALDRIVKLETKKKKFTVSRDADFVNYFKNSFGIIGPNKEVPEKVVFTVNPEQANYIKSFPLHTSQRIINTTPSSVKFEITVYITYDLIMEMLSYGEEIKVESPKKLITELTNSYSRAIQNYK